MYAVRFTNHAGRYGQFKDVETATWWANHEADGHTFIVHRIDED